MSKMRFMEIIFLFILIIAIVMFSFNVSALNYSMSATVYDSFSPGNNCAGDSFSCGTNTDAITQTGGSFTTNITSDGGGIMFFCATYIDGVNATTKTCLYRHGLTATSCDSIADVSGGNHTEYYQCPVGSMTGCGWNGIGGIPSLGVTNPSTAFQLNTSIFEASQRIIYTSYICNSTDPLQQNGSFQSATVDHYIIQNKQVVCSGTNYQSIIYPFGTSLGGIRACAPESVCDTSANYSFGNIMNDTYCHSVASCYDAIKDGGETAVDYGGIVCGNCSANGETGDAEYSFARALQEENTTERLSLANPFNATQYCVQGAQVGSGIIAQFLIILLVSGITIFLLFTVGIGGVIGFFLLFIAKFLKGREKKK